MAPKSVVFGWMIVVEKEDLGVVWGPWLSGLDFRGKPIGRQFVDPETVTM